MKGGKEHSLSRMNSCTDMMMKMENWEAKMDNMNLKQMLDEIDRALIENLAAELGFSSFERLENSSECIFNDYYVTYLSDGRWVWWNPQKYKDEDPIYFEDQESITQYIREFLKLDDQQLLQLRKGLDEIPQMKKCLYCEHEFAPTKVELLSDDINTHEHKYCSPECALDDMSEELKEDF